MAHSNLHKLVKNLDEALVQLKQARENLKKSKKELLPFLTLKEYESELRDLDLHVKMLKQTIVELNSK